MHVCYIHLHVYKTHTLLFFLVRSLDEWYAMVGNSTDDRQLHISRDSGLGVSSPKHGKVCNRHYNCTICHCVDPLLLLNVMALFFFLNAFSRH